MTRTKLELREKANIEKYIHNNTEVCVDAIMELYKMNCNTRITFVKQESHFVMENPTL